jgi:hypothetical protein
MKSIDRIVNSLPNSDQVALRYAFEMGVPDTYVEYEPGRFVGVNITKTDLHIEQKAGLWAEGFMTAHTVKFPEPVSHAYLSFEDMTDVDDIGRRDNLASDEDDGRVPYKLNP